MATKRALSFPLRLDPTLLSRLKALAAQEGLSRNHLIEMAVAEKIARMEVDCVSQSQFVVTNVRTPALPSSASTSFFTSCVTSH